MARVTVLGLPASWGDPRGALRAVDEELERGPATDIVLLPEQSLVGYVSPRGDFDLSRYAEPLDGPTVRAVAAIAVRHRVHLVAPLVQRGPGGLTNTTFVVDPGGALVATYAKRHPWIPERVWASRGRAPHAIVALGDLRATIAVCYDLHFLPDERDTVATLAAADLLLFPSAWVDTEDSRVPGLVALARRFGIAIANANWAPGVVRVPGQGGSCILDARGEALAAADPGVVRVDATVPPRCA